MLLGQILSAAQGIGVATLVAISIVCFLVVTIRNLVSTIQLLLAARVFATRIRADQRSMNSGRATPTWPPNFVIAPA